MSDNTQKKPSEDSEQRDRNDGKNSQSSFGIQDPPGPLKVIRLKDGRRLVTRDLEYRVGANTVITVKKGFKTDYSSDPIGLIDWSQADVAGVVHDYLYQHPGQIANIKTRAQEDKIWLQISRHGAWRVGPFRAYLGYLGIRLFGRLHRRGDSKTLTIGFALVIVLVAAWSLWKTCFCHCSMLEAAVCVLLALAGLKLIDHILGSCRRKSIQADDDDSCCTACGALDESASTPTKEVSTQTHSAA